MTFSPFMTPDAGPVRAAVERRSAFVVVWLAHLPRLLAPTVMAAVFVSGLIAPGVVGAVLLLVSAAALGLLSYLAWPSSPPRLRPMRLAILVAVVAFAVYKLT